jgi:hypothetical protein
VGGIFEKEKELPCLSKKKRKKLNDVGFKVQESKFAPTKNQT